jgi:hypothetical protein
VGGNEGKHKTDFSNVSVLKFYLSAILFSPTCLQLKKRQTKRLPTKWPAMQDRDTHGPYMEIGVVFWLTILRFSRFVTPDASSTSSTGKHQRRQTVSIYNVSHLRVLSDRIRQCHGRKVEWLAASTASYKLVNASRFIAFVPNFGNFWVTRVYYKF